MTETPDRWQRPARAAARAQPPAGFAGAVADFGAAMPRASKGAKQDVGLQEVAPLARMQDVALDEQPRVGLLAIDRVHVDHRHVELATDRARGFVVALVLGHQPGEVDPVHERDEVARRLEAVGL